MLLTQKPALMLRVGVMWCVFFASTDRVSTIPIKIVILCTTQFPRTNVSHSLFYLCVTLSDIQETFCDTSNYFVGCAAH